MFRRTAALIFSAGLLLSGHFALAQSGVSLDDVWRQSYRHNTSLQAARQELKATQETLAQAQSGWRPSVLSSANIMHSESDGSNFGGVTGSTSKSLELSFDQPLYRGGRTVAGIEAAKDVITARTAMLMQREQDILQQVTTAYMDVLRDEKITALRRHNAEYLSKELEATQARFDAGELTITDVSQAKARLASARAEVVAAEGALKGSRAVLEQVSGLTPAALSVPSVYPPVPETLQAALAEAEENNLDIRAAIASHRAAEGDVDGVFGELLPEVGTYGSINKTYDPQPGLIDKQTTKSIGVSASVPLYQGGAVRSRVRSAKYTANQRYIDILDARARVRQEMVSAWHNWDATRAEIESREAQVVAAQIAQEGVHYEADLGARTILDALNADQEALDAQVALVSARRNEVVARFAVLNVLGRLTPKRLGFAEDEIDYEQNLKDISNKVFTLNVDDDVDEP